MFRLSTLFFFTLIFVVSSDSKKCAHNEDCGYLYTCQNSMCLHKSLFPLQPVEWIASVLIFLMSALANSTGLGGGEIMVPLLILLFFFDTHSAVPLSLVIMLGGNFIKTVMRIPERQRNIDRPIIEYHLVAFTLAPLLIGATTGFFVNRILPDWFILALMTALLFYLTLYISQQALRVLNSSNQKQAVHFDHVQTVLDIETSVLKPFEQHGVFPRRPISIICAIFVFSLLFVFIRGDSSRASILGIQYCSRNFWIVFGFRTLVLLGVSLNGIRVMTKRSQELLDSNYSFEYDVRWNLKNSFFMVATAVLSGLGIGILGIGGSAIITPAMVYVGVNREVAKATVGAAVFLTCSVTLIQYIFAGMLQLRYAVWFFLISLLGASVGSWILTRMVHRFDKRAIPLVALTLILGITTIITPTYVITSIVKGISTENFQYGFKNFCNTE